MNEILETIGAVCMGIAVIVTNTTVNNLRKRIERLERER